jgi:hypothetical protein
MGLRFAGVSNIAHYSPHRVDHGLPRLHAITMPRFIFQVQQGNSPEIPVIEDVLCDSYAARKAALGMCADLAKDIVNGLTEDSEWRLNVLDETGKPVFRVRLLAEELGDHDTKGNRVYAVADRAGVVEMALPDRRKGHDRQDSNEPHGSGRPQG